MASSALIIVDGYNVLHVLGRRVQDGNGESFGELRGRLLELLDRVASAEGCHLHVYFDGNPGRGSKPHALGAVSVRFVENADRAIMSEIAEHRRPRRVRVVSSDREIVRRCRVEDVAVESSRDFVDRLLAFVVTPPPRASRLPAQGALEKARKQRGTKPPALRPLDAMERAMLEASDSLDALETEIQGSGSGLQAKTQLDYWLDEFGIGR